MPDSNLETPRFIDPVSGCLQAPRRPYIVIQRFHAIAPDQPREDVSILTCDFTAPEGIQLNRLSFELRDFAGRLAGGPAFLLLGSQGKDLLGDTAIGYHWNGIYTSSFDAELASAFDNQQRTSTSLGAMSRVPSRNQSDLEVRFLYGAWHLPENERPGKTEVERAISKSVANQELTRLVNETTTPKGTIVIEGWGPNDQLSVDDLIPMLGSLGPAQAHIFSAKEWASHPLVKALINSGQLILHERTLEHTLASLHASGSLSKTGNGLASSSRHVIPLGNKFIDVDIHTWNQVRRSARPMDLDILTPPIINSTAAKYQEFRNFVGSTEGVAHWRGLSAGMNLTRDFESTLYSRVQNEINDRNLPSPVILSGQTASGKSVALASLAMKLARKGEVAVLHQSRRAVRPSIDDIDVYSAWAEDIGAKATVLIWDGMVEPSEYEAFSRQLHTRGRKVLVVGSTYKTKDDYSNEVSAPAELSNKETLNLLKILFEYGIEIAKPKGVLDASFLSLLYRFLPETERKLRIGLASEMRAAERAMEKLVRARGEAAATQPWATALQAAFLEAGVELKELLPPEECGDAPESRSFAERAPLQRVTTLVLVAGRHGIPVPIDLALRILGREGFQSVSDALRSSDIIRDIEDDSGDYFLSTRSRLEAELLARHEIPVSVEIEVIIEAIRHIRIARGFVGGPDELEFLVKLLETIKPDFERSRNYRKYFGEIADALSERRWELGWSLPRLVLQESVFRREFVHWQNRDQQGEMADRVSTLEMNRDLLQEVLSDQSTKGLTRLSLSVELASTLGSIIHEYSSAPEGEYFQGMGSRLDDVLQAVFDARAVDPGNVFPVDVLAWSTRDAIESDTLTPSERIDRLASAVAALESLDRSVLTDKQLAKLDRRGLELNLLLKNDDAAWEYLGQLEVNRSPAATYFLAQFDAKDGPAGERKALMRLREAALDVRQDWRCAQLLIDLTWKEVVGQRLLHGERVPIYLDENACRTVTQLAIELENSEQPDRYRFLFARAIAEFSGENYNESKRLFREVGDLTRQLSKRIYTSCILSDKNGKPRSFTGRVEVSDTRSGTVWVNELATQVRFEPKLFTASGEFSRNQQLPAFHLGFKLSRGPVAEPRALFRGGSR